MYTILDKSESFHHTACIPNSWWEFFMEYDLHIYNRTPLRWHSWKTPYELLNGEQPDISHLKVFGCGAYVHLLKDMCTNKLSSKSELMCYLGPAEGIKGHCFMCSSKNTIFTAAQVLFDETLFPKCKTAQPTTHLTWILTYPLDPGSMTQLPFLLKGLLHLGNHHCLLNCLFPNHNQLHPWEHVCLLQCQWN